MGIATNDTVITLSHQVGLGLCCAARPPAASLLGHQADQEPLSLQGSSAEI